MADAEAETETEAEAETEAETAEPAEATPVLDAADQDSPLPDEEKKEDTD